MTTAVVTPDALARPRRYCLPNLSSDRTAHRPRRPAAHQGARRCLGRRAADWCDRGGARGAHPVAGCPPAPGGVVLPHSRRARHEHADLLHHLLRDGGADLCQHGAAQRAEQRAEGLLGGVRADAGGRDHRRGDDVVGPGGRPLHVVRAASRGPDVLPGRHPLRGRRAGDGRRLLRESRRGQARADLQRLAPPGRLRRDDGRHHCRNYARARRRDLHPDLSLVAGLDDGGSGGVPDALVGPRSFFSANQRCRHGLHLVHARCADHWLGCPQREDQPVGLRPLHPVHLDGISASPAGGSRDGPRMEGREHQLLHVHGGARLDDSRLHGASRHGARDAPPGIHERDVRLAAAGAVG